MSKIKKNIILFLTFLMIFGLFLPVTTNVVLAEEEPTALIIYTEKGDEINENQRTLDMLISHFTKDITLISSNDVTEEDLKGVTHLFYYGLTPEELPDRFNTLFDDYEGVFTAIGYNTEKLGDHYSNLNPKNNREVNEIWLTEEESKFQKEIYKEIIDITVSDDTEILIEGKKDGEDETYPVMVKKEDHYFYASDDLLSDKVILFGEMLHDVFGVNHDEEHPAYIRLEDIHPFVEVSNVKEIADVLKEKDIPYMVAVIPVYTDPKTGKTFHFSDSPKLLKQLKQMQKDGASIILHGYTHQFRQSETGEGFEFWDVESNTPIYAGADDDAVLKEESDFNSKEEYKVYLDELKAFETNYIEDRLTQGIDELVNVGLYPLAFEAPHYTMSQNGYKVASNFFSTYSGQIQLSDEDWEIMERTPYVSAPSFLGGMELLPETVGYMKPDNKDNIPNLKKEIENMAQTKDSVIAGFYHPYLGVEGFKEMINEMEKQPNMKWIDLKEEDVWVKSDKVKIYTEDGSIKLDKAFGAVALSSVDFVSYHYFKWSDYLFWIFCLLGGLATITFIVLIFVNNSKQKELTRRK